jgi:hypothetical protein
MQTANQLDISKSFTQLVAQSEREHALDRLLTFIKTVLGCMDEPIALIVEKKGKGIETKICNRRDGSFIVPTIYLGIPWETALETALQKLPAALLARIPVVGESIAIPSPY